MKDQKAALLAAFSHKGSVGLPTPSQAHLLKIQPPQFISVSNSSLRKTPIKQNGGDKSIYQQQHPQSTKNQSAIKIDLQMAQSHRQSINISHPKASDTANPPNNLNKGNSFKQRHASKQSNSSAAQGQQLLIEDFDDIQDSKFIKEYLVPYLSDLYKDLALRSFISTSSAAVPQSVQKKLDKVTFIQYCNLPGIISERLLKIFDTNSDGLITEESFVQHMTLIFISDLDSRIRLTFNIYDFNSDGFISKEDIKMVLYYVPFTPQEADPQLPNIVEQSSQEQINNGGGVIIQGQGGVPATTGYLARITRHFKIKRASETTSLSEQAQLNNIRDQASLSKSPTNEGMYGADEGRNLDYKDRMFNMKEVGSFVNKIFNEFPYLKQINVEQYNHIIKSVSSEMFLSLMSLLHQKLPCAPNCFRLKKIFRMQSKNFNTFTIRTEPVSHDRQSQHSSLSPVRAIASPRFLKGLTYFNFAPHTQINSPNTLSPYTLIIPDTENKGNNSNIRIQSPPSAKSLQKRINENKKRRNSMFSEARSQNPSVQQEIQLQNQNLNNNDGFHNLEEKSLAISQYGEYCMQQENEVTGKQPMFIRKQNSGLRALNRANGNPHQLKNLSNPDSIVSTPKGSSKVIQQIQLNKIAGQTFTNGLANIVVNSQSNGQTPIKAKRKLGALQNMTHTFQGRLQNNRYSMPDAELQHLATPLIKGGHGGIVVQKGMHVKNITTGNGIPSTAEIIKIKEKKSNVIQMITKDSQQNSKLSQILNGGNLTIQGPIRPNRRQNQPVLRQGNAIQVENLDENFVNFGAIGGIQDAITQEFMDKGIQGLNNQTMMETLMNSKGNNQNNEISGTFKQTKQLQENTGSLNGGNNGIVDIVIDDFSQSIMRDKQQQVVLEGDCYLKTKTERYKKHWAVLIGNEIYCYKSRDEPQHLLMHSLQGTFVKELPEEVLQSLGVSLWPLKIILLPTMSRILYFRTEEELKKWTNAMTQSIGQTNVLDFYNLEMTIGQGQFGQVKLATHKKTGSKVAVKIMGKKDIKSIEMYQIKKEIEVMKMCKHPNIVRLHDLFESSDSFYLILEYMGGGDLFDYLKARTFRLNEERAREIILQLTLAVQFLHSLGIVHRDIKLENVMMSDSSEHAIPKLADFGLAKIVGPSEKADEPFGTLGYAAPEVLRKEPYGAACDLWSLGCISHALLCGALPFDHETQRETARLTLQAKVTFHQSTWRNVSDEAKDFVLCLLTREPQFRYTAEQSLSHPWLHELFAQTLNSSTIQQ